ncbi:MAG: redox-sensing transcriptional repressor Rex, partial [Bilifractor sp.]
IENGIHAIWNFAHTDLNLVVPKNVAVQNVHLSESLMRLSYNLKTLEEK